MVTFGLEVTKILRDLCLYFARQDGQEGKKWQENHATKVTKIPKTKRQKFGMNETLLNFREAFERPPGPYMDFGMTSQIFCFYL